MKTKAKKVLKVLKPGEYQQNLKSFEVMRNNKINNELNEVKKMKIQLLEADVKQNDLLNNILEFNDKARRPKSKEDKKKKKSVLMKV